MTVGELIKVLMIQVERGTENLQIVQTNGASIKGVTVEISVGGAEVVLI